MGPRSPGWGHAARQVATSVRARECGVGVRSGSCSSHLGDDRLEDRLVRRVVHPCVEGKVEGIAGAALASGVVEVTGAGEEGGAGLMEGEGEDAVGQVEGLLHAVAVVDVNVHVQHARVHLEQLEDGEHDVVGVAEP